MLHRVEIRVSIKFTSNQIQTYRHDMGRLFNAIHREGTQFTLQELTNRARKVDVFVSHKSDDTALAIDVANCVTTYGLEAYVDELDPNIKGDFGSLDHYIANVLQRSFSLVAVVTDVTHESWWVPFEIGIAFELKKILASFIEIDVLPSFLDKHPKIRNHRELHRWCEEIKRIQREDKEELEYRFLNERTRAEDRSAYLETMNRLTREFR